MPALFAGLPLRSFLGRRLSEALEQVDRLGSDSWHHPSSDGDDTTTLTDVELAAVLFQRHDVVVPVIDWDSMSITVRAASASSNPRLTGDPAEAVAGISLTAAVPYEGTPDLLWYRPARRAVAARVEVLSSVVGLTYSIEGRHLHGEQVEREHADRRHAVATHLSYVADEVAAWRVDALHGLVEAVERRRVALDALQLARSTFVPFAGD